MIKSVQRLSKMFCVNPNSTDFKFVVSSIEGNIACGKSTILDHLSSKNHKNIHCLQEPVAEWQNMSSGTDILKLFYEETTKWSFSFENLVQLSRLKSFYESQNFIREKNSTNSLCDKNRMKVFLERSVLSSYNVFVKNSFEEKRLNSIEFGILTKYYQFFTQKANKITHSMEEEEHENTENIEKNPSPVVKDDNTIPFQVLYIRTDPEICYQRLQRRSRESETNIDLAYLTAIHNKYEAWINTLLNENTNYVQIIDGNKDKASVISQIDKFIFS